MKKTKKVDRKKYECYHHYVLVERRTTMYLTSIVIVIISIISVLPVVRLVKDEVVL